MVRAKVEDQRREEILAAFETCVVRKGLLDTTLQDVATEAGLPRSLVRYFMGNRDDMVGLLIERMVARAESGLLLFQQQRGTLDAPKMVEFLFEAVFADETSNVVVGELWYLAQRDEETRQRLKALYARLAQRLTATLGEDPAVQAPSKDVQGVAFSLLSLAYGEASFRTLGMTTVSRARIKEMALRLVSTLTHGKDR
ncbi:MAG: hypothetical protein QM778_04825 [Myxococcales bacterium]